MKNVGRSLHSGFKATVSVSLKILTAQSPAMQTTSVLQQRETL